MRTHQKQKSQQMLTISLFKDLEKMKESLIKLGPDIMAGGEKGMENEADYYTNAARAWTLHKIVEQVGGRPEFYDQLAERVGSSFFDAEYYDKPLVVPRKKDLPSLVDFIREHCDGDTMSLEVLEYYINFNRGEYPEGTKEEEFIL